MNPNSLNAGLSNQPKVASVIENELQGLQDTADSLSATVSALHQRLATVLRSPSPMKTGEAGERPTLSAIPDAVRSAKEKIQSNVFSIQDLLDRLEV